MPAVKGFLPSQNGLHFSNNFNQCGVIPLEFNVLGITVRGGKAANGICGGFFRTEYSYHESTIHGQPITIA